MRSGLFANASHKLLSFFEGWICFLTVGKRKKANPAEIMRRAEEELAQC